MVLFKSAWRGNNKEKALKAVEKRTNQKTLAVIAKSAPFAEVRIAAIRKITDQSILVGIVRDQYIELRIRRAAIETISDQNILVELYYSLDSWHSADERQLHNLAYEKIKNGEEYREASAAKEAAWNARLPAWQAEYEAEKKRNKAQDEAREKEKARREEKISKGICPKCGSNNKPIHRLINHLDMYGDLCPDCGEVIRLF